MAMERADLQYEAVPNSTSHATADPDRDCNLATCESCGLPAERLGTVGLLHCVVRQWSTVVQARGRADATSGWSAVQRGVDSRTLLCTIAMPDRATAPRHSTAHTGNDACAQSRLQVV